MDDERRDTLKEHAWGFDSVSLESVGDRSLPAALSDRLVVALGTAAPGAREPTRFRGALVRALVERTEQAAVALPVGFVAGARLDEYAAGERSARREALLGVDPAYQTEALGVLFEWLRSYNADRPTHEQVRVYGLGAGSIADTVARLQTYLDRVDAPFLETVRSNLDRIRRASGADPDEYADTTAYLDELIEYTREVLTTVRTRLDDHRESYVTTGGLDAWERARQYTTLLEQRVSVLLARKQFQEGAIDDETASERLQHLRGLTMADNLDWLLDAADPDQMLVLAHDSDVARVEQTHRGQGVVADRLGTLLAARYGLEYYALGSLLDGGTVRVPPTAGRGGTRPLPALAPGPVDDWLAGLYAPVGLLDFVSGERPVPLLEGDEEQTHQSLRVDDIPPSGSGASQSTYVTEDELNVAFDGVYRVGSVEPAAPLDEPPPEDP